MHKLEQALRGIRRGFIGEFRSRRDRHGRSKYVPHIGDRQRARIARQIAKGQLSMKGVER